MLEYIDWQDIYLLGWYDKNKEPFLTMWEGDHPIINVVVIGTPNPVNFFTFPIWDNPVPENLKAIKVPLDRDPHEYADELGGIFAFGWAIPNVRRNLL